MFRQVVTPDIRLIIRGLFILLTIIAVGVGIVEYQMATLTHRPAQDIFAYRVVVTIANYLIPVPMKIETYFSRLAYWFTIWQQQFVEEAFSAKKAAGEYWKQSKPYIEAAMHNLRIKTRQGVQQMDEYIREYR
ncbi:hypothetical protein SOV_19760 [Sporomusa ovata DSM 2662]|uniref:Uncharacterized protein n=1 Tax=Sporomusa ovata TaxID=2378 RepID=A0A0U1KXC9_9FIRM|nr:hypothetical protein [Sporomusa ovata]EQB29574.1 hypothetical protein SOV_1c13080 [Sporomusa ovata DSM 2662]CQR72088.1 hypothetical protein SpAn4DRAFT_4777 [Sporomusa ovata]